jgi:hypothetical protein
MRLPRLPRCWWLSLGLVALSVALSPFPAAAQNSPIQGWCEAGAQTVVLSGLQSSTNVQASYPQCLVTVNIHGGSAATIFSDASGTPLANPFAAQTNGQWQFYVATNTAVDVITSANPAVPQDFGMPTTTYSNIIAGGGGGGGGSGTVMPGTGGDLSGYIVSGDTVGDTGVVSANVNTNAVGYTPGNLPSASGLHTLQDSGIAATTAAIKPHVTDAAQYATANGNDSNDGLSLGTAKLTVYGALLGLPGGNAATYTAGSGTINLQSGSTAISAGGPASAILILGSNDPHWNNTLASCVRSGNSVTLTFNANHNYILPWSSSTTYSTEANAYTSQAVVSYMGQNYKSLISGNLNNVPTSTLGTDWQVFGAPGAQQINVYGTTGGANSFNGTFSITGGTLTTLTYAQTGPNESCTPSTGAVLPFGFLKESGSVNFFATGSQTESNSPGATGLQIAGAGLPQPMPQATLQLSGTNDHYYSNGINWSGCIPVALGVDSNYLQSIDAATFSTRLDNGGLTISFQNAIGCGPNLEIGRNVLWLKADNNVYNTLGETTYNISSVVRSGNVSTAVLSSGPGGGLTWQVGDSIIIAGFTDTSYDGIFPITSVTSNTQFSYNNQGANCPSSCGDGGSGVAGLGAENDRRAAILLNPVGGNSGLLYTGVSTFNGGGGIRATTPIGTSSSFQNIGGIEMEGAGNSQPIYECKTTNCPTANFIGQYGLSDSGNSPPAFMIAPGNGQSTTVQCLTGGNPIQVQGPVITIGCSLAPTTAIALSSTAPNQSPGAMGQQGTFTYGQNARLWGDTLDLQRSGVPTNVAYANLAATNPASWTNVTGGNLTITTGVTDALRGTGAANLSVSTGNGEADSYSGTRTVKSGDYFIGGVWAQASTTAGWQGIFHNGPLQIVFSSSAIKTRGISKGIPGQQSILNVPNHQDDGSWQWIWTLDSMTGADTSETVKLEHQVATGFPVNFYAPILLHIPLATISRYNAPITSVAAGGGFATYTTTSAHTLLPNQITCIEGVTDASFDGCLQIIAVSSTTFQTTYAGASTSSTGGTAYATADSEAAEIAQHLASYSNLCAVGQSCTVYGAADGGTLSTQSSAYTLKATDTWTNVTGTTTITIPHAIAGQKWTVFNSGTNTVTLSPDSGNISYAGSTASTASLSTKTGAEITCDGTNCFAH